MSYENISDEEFHNREPVPSDEMRSLPNETLRRQTMEDVDQPIIHSNETQEIWQEIRRL